MSRARSASDDNTEVIGHGHGGGLLEPTGHLCLLGLRCRPWRPNLVYYAGSVCLSMNQGPMSMSWPQSACAGSISGWRTSFGYGLHVELPSTLVSGEK